MKYRKAKQPRSQVNTAVVIVFTSIRSHTRCTEAHNYSVYKGTKFFLYKKINKYAGKHPARKIRHTGLEYPVQRIDLAGWRKEMATSSPVKEKSGKQI